MKNKTLCMVAILSSLAMVGCASRASSIAPAGIPSANYSGLSCDENKEALEQKRIEKYALTYQQNNAAIADTVTVLLVLLPVGSIFGADKEGELAQVKGEVLALESAMPRNCST